MGKIGMVCNPQSGKDIRRLVTSATTINDSEKLNIIQRVTNSILQTSDHNIYIMPDRFGYGKRLIRKLEKHEVYSEKMNLVEVLDMKMLENQSDSQAFARKMSEIDADVLVVLGGDGTNRVVAKGAGDIPIISISTGTNNVFPKMVEGTTVGLAASAIASGFANVKECSNQSKIIEIKKNGEVEDIALIDLVFCKNGFVGSRAIWDYGEIDYIVSTQCHPASIGFSSLIGTSYIVDESDDYGASANFNLSVPNTFAPMGAGSIQPLCIDTLTKFSMNNVATRKMSYNGTLALDGEREVTFTAGDVISFTITRNGPRKLDIRKTLEVAMKNGFFKYSNMEGRDEF